ncbi:MAG TPA: hypothetical protein VI643_00450 [Planctomycetota bacterium]|nr:hypothetical protein [Planctomycetota bacterium]
MSLELPTGTASDELPWESRYDPLLGGVWQDSLEPSSSFLGNTVDKVTLQLENGVRVLKGTSKSHPFVPQPFVIESDSDGIVKGALDPKRGFLRSFERRVEREDLGEVGALTRQQ